MGVFSFFFCVWELSESDFAFIEQAGRLIEQGAFTTRSRCPEWRAQVRIRDARSAQTRIRFLSVRIEASTGGVSTKVQRPGPGELLNGHALRSILLVIRTTGKLMPPTIGIS